MILGNRAELAGRVKLQISGGVRGTIDYPWQDNMILDQGFEQLITGFTTSPVAFTSFGVGSSSQAVQPTDTGLISPIAFTSASSVGVTHGWDAEGGFGWSRATRSFARGAAAGNISELTTGYANNNTSAMARALVRDSQGNPTTITVLSDEILTITWEWRKWWGINPSNTLSYDVDGVQKTTTVSYKQNLSTGNTGLGNGGITPIGAQLVPGTPPGTFIGAFKRTFTENQGNPQVASVASSGDAPTGSRNSAGVVFPYDTAYATFDPPIAKTNEFTLEIAHVMVLTRRQP